jgi:hypothetical protein
MTWQWVVFLGFLFTFVLWLMFGIKIYLGNVKKHNLNK